MHVHTFKIAILMIAISQMITFVSDDYLIYPIVSYEKSCLCAILLHSYILIFINSLLYVNIFLMLTLLAT